MTTAFDELPPGMASKVSREVRQQIVPGECWIWTAACNPKGYGIYMSLKPKGFSQLAHRCSYQLLVGEIPPGLHMDHLCRVRPCINPAHLEPVTPRENALRGDRGQAMRCKKGHPLVEPNVIIRKIHTHNRPGYPTRRCRVCQSDAEREFLEKRRTTPRKINRPRKRNQILQAAERRLAEIEGRGGIMEDTA